jgi:hypothetical protein
MFCEELVVVVILDNLENLKASIFLYQELEKLMCHMKLSVSFLFYIHLKKERAIIC